MKSTLLAGLWPMSVSFPITLTQRNMQVSQVVMNALSDTWPFSLHAARLVRSLCCILSVSSLFLTRNPIFSLLGNILQFKCVSDQFRQYRCQVFCLFLN